MSLALTFTLYPAVSIGLKPEEVSLAAERRARLPAIAALDPDEKIRNPDYLAEKFLPPEFWFIGLLTTDRSPCSMP